MKLFDLLLITVLIFMSPTIFASGFTESIEKAINVDPSRPLNGVVLVAHNHQVIYKKASGVYGSPKLNSKFFIGSITKQFTAAIILGLVDKGLINLDDSITNYLPELSKDLYSKVKVKHLLNHTHGITEIGKAPTFEPGSKFTYSSTLGSYLSSQIAEKVSGQNFNKQVKDLFKKVGMRNSEIISSEKMSDNYYNNPNLAKAFIEKSGKILELATAGAEGEVYNNSWNAGGGIISTAEDLVKWNRALHSGKILSKSIYKEMITPSAERNHPRYGKIGYGYGVQIYDNGSTIEISHSGYIDGYISTLSYYPKNDLTVIVLENISWDVNNISFAFKVHDAIRDIILNQH